MKHSHSKKSRRPARRYAEEIPGRDVILQLLRKRKAPLPVEQIAHELKVSTHKHEFVVRRLKAMCRDGQLVRNRKNAYGVAKKMDLLRGRVVAKRDGFGFLAREDGDDLYLSPREMRRVLHGDLALASVTRIDRKGRPEGAIVEILERANHSLVGRFHGESGIFFITPDDARLTTDFLVPPGKGGDAREGDVVFANIIKQPQDHQQPLAEVVEVLGEADTPKMAEDIAIRGFSLPHRWSQEVIAEAAALPDQVGEQHHAGRRDIRDLPLVTIDGKGAKDFDDAVYCQARDQGWRLLVAIADVSAYVAPGSALDAEAQERGTSVYFPQRVIPMLPEKLSNGLCSLKPDVDRLCLVCDMLFDAQGNTTRSRFYPALMRSAARLTYTTVAEFLTGSAKKKSAFAKRHGDAVTTQLQHLHALYKRLSTRRVARGALEFDSSECRFEFSPMGEITAIVPLLRNDAHKLIEECMIAANVAAAGFVLKHKLPAPLRIHEPPRSERLEVLSAFLNSLSLNGFVRPDSSPTPKDFARLTRAIADRPDRHVIETMLLRSQNLAVYQTANLGHFGLALERYAHFTSPIRRYPDLLLHRAIKAQLATADGSGFEYAKQAMDTLCEHSSMAERRAEEASRDVTARLQCLWLADQVGASFPGCVSGVTSFGLFVELDGLGISGLLHVTSLRNDYYHFDSVRQTLTGERTRESYRLGDRLTVQVTRVDPQERKIDFALATDT